MDKFSQLIAKGVAAFRYTPIAPAIPEQCPMCRAYNNTFGAATDTHMSHLDDGRIVVTGHIISDPRKFDQFIYASMYGGVNFRHSGYWSFCDFMSRYNLVGTYDVLNGDNVYMLKPIEERKSPEEGKEGVCIPNCPDCSVVSGASFVTSESSIPQNGRFLSRHGDFMEVAACANDNPFVMAKAMNESINIYGNNWCVTNLSDGTHIIGFFDNKAYIL
jgi:hypothetical protein